MSQCNTKIDCRYPIQLPSAFLLAVSQINSLAEEVDFELQVVALQPTNTAGDFMKKIFLSFMALALLVAPKTFAQSKLATICSGGKGDDKIEVVYHNLLGIEVQKHSTFYKFEQRNISYTENEIIATLDKMNQNSDGQTYTDTNVRLEMKFIESTRSNAVYLLIEELTMNGQKKSPKDVRILKCE